MTLAEQIVKEDVRTLHRKLYSVSKSAQTIGIHKMPEMNYLVSSGIGDRNIQRIRDIKEFGWMFVCNNRIRSYTVKELHKNFIMSPFEFQWAEDTQEGTRFKAGLWVPDYVTELHLKNAMLDRLGNDNLPVLLEREPEGLCAQFLHIGSYLEVEELAEKLRNEIIDRGYTPLGRHKEIYMSHTNIGWPNHLKIIIRQSIKQEK